MECISESNARMTQVSIAVGTNETESDVISVKVEPIYAEPENQTMQTSDDDMRHVEQDEQNGYGNGQMTEERNGVRGMENTVTENRGGNNNHGSRLPGKTIFNDENTLLYEKDFEHRSEDYGSFTTTTSADLTEPYLLDREVVSVNSPSSNDDDDVVGTSNQPHLADIRFSQDSIHFDSASDGHIGTCGRAIVSSSDVGNGLNSNRVKPVSKANSNCMLLTSARGYIMLLADSYRYGKERNRGNRHYWRCRVRGCHGRAVTVRDQFHQHTLVSASRHSHAPPDSRITPSLDSNCSRKIGDSRSPVTLANDDDDLDKTARLDDLDKVEDDVFINNVDDSLPVFVDEEPSSMSSVYSTKCTEKEEICKTVLPKRGRLTLIARNFMYGRDRCRNDRHYWRCRIRQCHGRAVTKDDNHGNHVLVACTPHSHSPSDYPESVMAEALELQDKPSSVGRSAGSAETNFVDRNSIGNLPSQRTVDSFTVEKDSSSPEHFSDVDGCYGVYESLKESITIVHPKEVGEDTVLPSVNIQPSNPLSKTKFQPTLNANKSMTLLSKRIPSSSPEIDDNSMAITVQRSEKEKKITAPQVDWHKPQYLAYEEPEYEHWSDGDCPVGDENCMCHTSNYNHRDASHCDTGFGESHDLDRNLTAKKSTFSSCHLVKSHTGVMYLLANRYAHLKDNIQKDQHYWKCHLRHCTGQAITRLIGTLHSLIEFTPHDHPPMTNQQFQHMGFPTDEIGNLLPEKQTSQNRDTSKYLDLNSHSFLPKETGPFEICRHVVSRRGKHILIARGYSFGIERNRKERYYWRCKLRSCRGRAVTKMLNDGTHALLHFANHSHPPMSNCQSYLAHGPQDNHHCLSDYREPTDIHSSEGQSMIDLNRRVAPKEVPEHHAPCGRHMHLGNQSRDFVKAPSDLGDRGRLPSMRSPLMQPNSPLPHTRNLSLEHRKPMPPGNSRLSEHFHSDVPPFYCNPERLSGLYYPEHLDGRNRSSHGLKSPVERCPQPLSPLVRRDQDARNSVTSPSFHDSFMTNAVPCGNHQSRVSHLQHSPFQNGVKRVSPWNHDGSLFDNLLSKRSRLDVPLQEDTPLHFDVELKLGEKVIEGKTKVVYALPEYRDGGYVLLESKDRITCGDGARADNMEGKAELSTSTTSSIFELLNQVGVKTHFLQKHTETKFIAQRCEMVPLEFVTRRIATGSFLRRNPGVKEGFRFAPPILETFFKDDANHDPQWSREQCLEAGLTHGGVTIGRRELDIMGDTAVAVFEILEKAWAFRNCVLVDMKVEFGINPKTKEIVLADVIDNDSWRLWPAGDKRLMRDKQVYRNLREVTPQAMEEIKKNYKWVADECKALLCKPSGRIVIFMGSGSDKEHGQKIQKFAKQYGVPSELRVTSAHKGTEETIKILRWYEAHGIPTVFIAIAGRSNGLGPVLSGNTAYPVINCPPVKADWGTADIWSSLRLPSGLGCTTVIDPQAAALAAAQIVGMHDHIVWGTMRAHRLTNLTTLMNADSELESS